MFRTNRVAVFAALVASLAVVVLANPLALGLCGYRPLTPAEQRDADGGQWPKMCETTPSKSCPSTPQGNGICNAHHGDETACIDHDQSCHKCESTINMYRQCIFASTGTCVEDQDDCGRIQTAGCEYVAGMGGMCQCPQAGYNFVPDGSGWFMCSYGCAQ